MPKYNKRKTTVKKTMKKKSSSAAKAKGYTKPSGIESETWVHWNSDFVFNNTGTVNASGALITLPLNPYTVQSGKVYQMQGAIGSQVLTEVTTSSKQQGSPPVILSKMSQIFGRLKVKKVRVAAAMTLSQSNTTTATNPQEQCLIAFHHEVDTQPLPTISSSNGIDQLAQAWADVFWGPFNIYEGVVAKSYRPELIQGSALSAQFRDGWIASSEVASADYGQCYVLVNYPGVTNSTSAFVFHVSVDFKLCWDQPSPSYGLAELVTASESGEKIKKLMAEIEEMKEQVKKRKPKRL